LTNGKSSLAVIMGVVNTSPYLTAEAALFFTLHLRSNHFEQQGSCECDPIQLAGLFRWWTKCIRQM